MERGWWKKAVPVQVSAATTVNVNNTVQAGRLLLGEWPGKSGPAHVAAMEVVLEALDNMADARHHERARRAFVKAAEEAGILRET